MEHSLICRRDWTLLLADGKRLKIFDIWIWRRMERVSWKDKVTNASVLQRVNETILDTIWHQKHSWIGHVLRHDDLLKDIFKGKMTGKPARGINRWNILSDLADKDKYVALKRRAENTEKVAEIEES